MAEISRFFGITVQMCYNDHEPPRFHVRYSGQKALIAIETVALCEGVFRLAHWAWSRNGRPCPSGVDMLKDIVAAKALGDYRLHLEFEDGVAGVVDLADHLSFRGIFAPMRDAAYFAQVYVDPELGTVAWPNGADLDPDVLYGRIVRTAVFP